MTRVKSQCIIIIYNKEKRCNVIKTLEDYHHELSLLRESHDLPTDITEFVYHLLQLNPLGVDIHFLALHTGHHWNDYKAVYSIISDVRRQYNVRINYLRLPSTVIFSLRDTELTPYLKQVKKLYAQAKLLQKDKSSDFKLSPNMPRGGRPKVEKPLPEPKPRRENLIYLQWFNDIKEITEPFTAYEAADVWEVKVSTAKYRIKTLQKMKFINFKKKGSRGGCKSTYVISKKR